MYRLAVSIEFGMAMKTKTYKSVKGKLASHLEKQLMDVC